MLWPAWELRVDSCKLASEVCQFQRGLGPKMNETFRHRRFQVTVTRSFTQFSIGFTKNAIFIGDILGVLPSIHIYIYIYTGMCVCIYIYIYLS